MATHMAEAMTFEVRLPELARDLCSLRVGLTEGTKLLCDVSKALAASIDYRRVPTLFGRRSHVSDGEEVEQGRPDLL